MLPLSYVKGGIVIELELCNSFAEPLIEGGGATFTTAKTSELWRLENCQIKADILHLDNGFQNSYDAHMLDGGMLAINFQGYVTSQQSISGDKVTVNLSRQSSHLKGVFVSFHKSNTNTDYLFKEWNKFYHPMDNATAYETNAYPYDVDQELQWQIQIGGKTFPQTPVNSIAESWSQLRKAVARYGKHPVSITPAQYHSTKFVAGLDLEALPQVGYTGLSTKNGEMITVKVQAVNPSTAMTGHMPTSLFMVLCNDSILELRDSGCSVLD
jgi:hypothetical protein